VRQGKREIWRVAVSAPSSRPTLARTKGDFQFANERERDDNAITELPNPLSPRRAIN